MVNQKVSDKPQVREIRPPTKQEIREALLIECAPREIDEADFMLTIIQEDPGKLTDNLFF
jgi:hypothetical protein